MVDIILLILLLCEVVRVGKGFLANEEECHNFNPQLIFHKSQLPRYCPPGHHGSKMTVKGREQYERKTGKKYKQIP